MGMFDLIIFEKPIRCECGHRIESAQTKVFASSMETYRVGDLVLGTSIISLEKDWVYCDRCSVPIEFYIACAYGIYLGVFERYRAGREAIERFGMGQLLQFYVRKSMPSNEVVGEPPLEFMERLVHFYDTPNPQKEGRFALYDFTEATPLEAIKNYLKKDRLARTINHLYAERAILDIEYKVMDENLIEIYNAEIQEHLKRDVLFRLISVRDRETFPPEDNLLVSYRRLDEEEVLSKVQEWLDHHRVSLQVALA